MKLRQSFAFIEDRKHHRVARRRYRVVAGGRAALMKMEGAAAGHEHLLKRLGQGAVA